ncbi:hypothetical protein MHU86_9204 [Fragilaria crotonensis]|nr:hypothetical protein MHU86_9204 [Fragilaria crotonensis]
MPSRSVSPTISPSNTPSLSLGPSQHPSEVPSVSLSPSRLPSVVPSTSKGPSERPSIGPSLSIIPSSVPSISSMPSVRTICLVEANEDFETGLAPGWTNFTSVNSQYPGYFSNFLGPFERSQQPMKSFELSPATTKVRVQFDFYQIDTWDGNSFFGPDKFKVFVNNNLVDLGFFTKETTDNRASGSTPVDGGIRWRREYMDSSRSRIFGPTVDERHHITIDIPESKLAPSEY